MDRNFLKAMGRETGARTPVREKKELAKNPLEVLTEYDFSLKEEHNFRIAYKWTNKTGGAHDGDF